jgi:hypothetical protein
MRPTEGEFAQIVTRHRDTAISGLNFEPNVTAGLAKSEVELLTLDLSQVSKGWERRRVVENMPSLPKVRGLYMFVWAPPLTLMQECGKQSHVVSWVLYVGKAGVDGGTHDTIKDRYASEYKKYVSTSANVLWQSKTSDHSAVRAERMKKFFSLQPLDFWFLPMEDTNMISGLEKRLIRYLNPPLNKQHSGPKIRPANTVSAF